MAAALTVLVVLCLIFLAVFLYTDAERRKERRQREIEDFVKDNQTPSTKE